jgi:transposase
VSVSRRIHLVNSGDELRENGFSKDGKHSQPQVVLGLLVSKDGYPLSYSVFNGSQYEGRTMLPVVEDFIHRFNLDDFIVVADSGLMNQKNIALLESGNYKYIIGARIKNESNEIKKWALSLSKQDGGFNEIKKGTARLIIGYSDNRAKKDKHNREKGVKRLEKAYRSGNITKENINKRGYNKFLEISDNVRVAINQDKIKQDEQWDGLKGYLTNTNLPAKEVYEQYSGLWSNERAFKLIKQNIQIKTFVGPSENSVKSQIFVALIVYLLLELIRRVRCKGKTAFSNFCKKVRICLLHYLSFQYICSISRRVQKVEMPPGKTLFDVDKLFVQTH